MKPFLIYSVGRFGVFALLAALLWFLGLSGFFAVGLSLVLSVPVSFVLLGRQRAALAGEVERRITDRRTRRERFRARLRGETADGAENGSGA